MSIPDEYTLEGLRYSAYDLAVYRAWHPIHREVSIHVPADNLSKDQSDVVKRRLYQDGIQMRSLSQLDLPSVTAALEVSQNPNEPYIVTQHADHYLQELLDDRSRLKPKRVYEILSQVLNGMVHLADNGCNMDDLTPYHIVLDDAYQGNVSLTPIGTTGSHRMPLITTSISTKGQFSDTMTLKPEKDPPSPFSPTQTLQDGTIDRTQTLQDGAIVQSTQPGVQPTMTLAETDGKPKGRTDLGVMQKNMYALGDIAYQLLFEQEYHQQDASTAANIKTLAPKWRGPLGIALSPNIADRYDSYEAMLCAVNKALSRNKTIAIRMTPVLALLLIAGCYFGYILYKEYAIKHSGPGETIGLFLKRINETDSEFPDLKAPVSTEASDDAILKPFDEVADKYH